MRRPGVWIPPLFVVVFLATSSLCGCADRAPDEVPADHAEGLYLQGTSAYLQGDFEAAEAAFTRLQAVAPGDPRLPAARGELLLAQGRPTEALTEFERAAERDPTRSTNWSRIGFIQSQLGRGEEAAAALHKALSLNARDFTALQTLAELAVKAERTDDAVSWLVRAADVSPNAAATTDLLLRAAALLEDVDRHDDATRLLQSAAGRGAASPRLLLALGEALVRSRRFEDAIVVLSRAARRIPADPSVWELVGELQVRQGRHEDARSSFARSLEIEDRAVVHVALARLHAAEGDLTAAQAALESALQSATGEEEGETLELARLLAELGRAKDALALMAALAAEPQNVTDVPLQREVVTLAKRVGAPAAVGAACARLRQIPDGGVEPGCP